MECVYVKPPKGSARARPTHRAQPAGSPPASQVHPQLLSSFPSSLPSAPRAKLKDEITCFLLQVLLVPPTQGLIYTQKQSPCQLTQ